MESKNWKVESPDQQDLESIIHLEEKYFSDDRWSEELIRRLFKEDPDSYLIIKDSGKALGFAHISESWNLPNYNSQGQAGFVDNIAVDQEYRGQGVGSTLMEEAVKRLTEKGAEKISFCTRVSNISMQKLGEKFGFKNTGISPEDQYPDGEEAYSFELEI